MATTTCKKCGGIVSEKAKFCPHCGTLINVVKYCPECGSPLGGNSPACANCGYVILQNPQQEYITQQSTKEKPVKKMGCVKRIFIGFGIFLVISIVGNVLGKIKNSSGQNGTYQKVDIWSVVQEYEDNQARAKDKWGNRSVEFLGTISSIGDDWFGIVNPKGNEFGQEYTGVLIETEGDTRETLKTLDDGQTVKVQGKIGWYNGTGHLNVTAFTLIPVETQQKEGVVSKNNTESVQSNNALTGTYSFILPASSTNGDLCFSVTLNPDATLSVLPLNDATADFVKLAALMDGVKYPTRGTWRTDNNQGAVLSFDGIWSYGYIDSNQRMITITDNHLNLKTTTRYGKEH